MSASPTSHPRHVSTGALPDPFEVVRLVDEAHTRFVAVADGALSTVYPALERADPSHFGICVAGVAGRVAVTGDVEIERFTIMSVAKPFAFALACDVVGPETAGRLIGVNVTGLPFNALEAVERSPDGRTNPMVNPGAIATVGLLPGEDADERWARSSTTGSRRSPGRPLPLDEEVYASASATNLRNRDLVAALAAAGAIAGDPDVALDLYTRQCSLAVSATDLALMGATLANGGVHPRPASASARTTLRPRSS